MSRHAMNAVEAAAAIREGQMTSRELVDDCLERIDEFEEGVKAWTFLDPDHARAQADRLDALRRKGRPTGPLHGLPVGIKDIFDTADMPTELGSPLYSGRRPRHDSTVVAKLREAGAVILGKTVTTEFASFQPGKTTNPHDPARTPGGSSSGSAAAVASLMCPLAVGSQTVASVVRPAAFCGIYGFKPSRGMISRAGVLCQSEALDHVGVFARNLEDIALMSESVMGFDPADPATAPPLARLPLSRVLAEDPPVAPRLAFAKTPVWDQAEPAMQEACGEVVEALDGRAEALDLPAAFDRVHGLHQVIMEADIAKHFGADYDRGAAQISDGFKALIERGRDHGAVAYNRAIDAQSLCNDLLDEIFDAYDAILTPAAPGEAPIGLETTGNPVFGTIWTFSGVPAITLPICRGAAGLPMGIQLIGQKGDDARLLRTARWLVARLTED
jgi:Asp-tRNA(Asn)/Glu-tRNA(Gln) amidotransferase A subunit family amidase